MNIALKSKKIVLKNYNLSKILERNLLCVDFLCVDFLQRYAETQLFFFIKSWDI